MKGAANTCPTVDSLYKNLLQPGVFDTVVVFKRSPPLCRQILSIETVQAHSPRKVCLAVLIAVLLDTSYCL